MPAPRVIVLADDLIWSTRLTSLLSALGAGPVAVRSAQRLSSALDSGDRLVVDLTSLAYDGIAALEEAARRGIPAIAVAQHDDLPLRKRALEAGAERVYAYRKLFEDGPRTLGRWLGMEEEVGTR